MLLLFCALAFLSGARGVSSLFSPAQWGVVIYNFDFNLWFNVARAGGGCGSLPAPVQVYRTSPNPNANEMFILNATDDSGQFSILGCGMPFDVTSEGRVVTSTQSSQAWSFSVTRVYGFYYYYTIMNADSGLYIAPVSTGQQSYLKMVPAEAAAKWYVQVYCFNPGTDSTLSIMSGGPFYPGVIVSFSYSADVAAVFPLIFGICDATCVNSFDIWTTPTANNSFASRALPPALPLLSRYNIWFCGNNGQHCTMRPLQISLSPCPAGYGQWNGTTCAPCATGSFSLEGDDVCRPCSPGSYSSSIASSECTPCGPGSVTPGYSSTSCTPCLPGSFTPSLSASDFMSSCSSGDTCLGTPFVLAAAQTLTVGSQAAETYALDTNYFAVLTPPAGSYVSVRFSAFVTELNYDFVAIFADTTLTAAIFGPASGSTDLSAVHSGACGASIVVQFFSDSSVVAAGVVFVANAVSCSSTPSTGAFIATECLVCAAGKYQPLTGQTSCMPCSPGTAAPANSSTSCTQCLPGSYALSAGSAYCSLCPGGRWSSLQGALICSGSCLSGSYCPEGSTSPVACPAGAYCPALAAAPTNCSGGTYNPSLNAESSSACQYCPAGVACFSGSSTDSMPCPAGYYCEEKNGPSACPPGTWSSALRAISTGVCAQCNTTAGMYCALASTQASGNAPCPVASFCPEGVNLPQLCPVGTFGATLSLSTAACSGQCQPGSFCPEGSAAPQTCPSGRYCPAIGASAPESCRAGTWSAALGASSSSVCRDCPPLHFCPPGSSAPTPCFPAALCPNTSTTAMPVCVWDVETLAGQSSWGFADGVGTRVLFNQPQRIAPLQDGAFVIADVENNRIRVLQPLTGQVSTIAGSWWGYMDGDVSSALFKTPTGVVQLRDKSIIVSEYNGCRVRRISMMDNSVSTVAGNGQCVHLDGVGTNAGFKHARSVGAFFNDDIAVAEFCWLRVIKGDGTVLVLAGNGVCGSIDGTGTSARVDPNGITVFDDTVYAANFNTVRRVTRDGIVTTLAGSVQSGFSDSSDALDATFSWTRTVAVDASGAVVVADGGNNALRLLYNNAVTTIAGFNRVATTTDGPAATAAFNLPHGVTITRDGVIYVSEQNGQVVRRLTCRPCPKGSYCPTQSKSLPCKPGHYCPEGSSSALPCAPGSFSPTESRLRCILCFPGTFQPHNGSLNCDSYCDAGSYRAQPGAASQADCSPCAAGSYGLFEGAASCTLCPSGTASSALGADTSATCIPCRDGWVAQAGSSACTECDPGSSPNTEQSSCDPGYTCPKGTVPKTISAPLSAASCENLTCVLPLLLPPLLVEREACLGCGVGMRGAFPTCINCSTSELCPGATASALTQFVGTLAVASSSRCPSLVGPGALQVSVSVDAETGLLMSLLSTGVFSSDVAVLVGVVIATSVLVLFSIAVIMRTSPRWASKTAAIDATLRHIDFFAIQPCFDEGESPRLRRRPIGGFFTVISFAGVISLALSLILGRFSSKNVLSTETVLLLTPTRLGLIKTLPVASSDTWGSGVQVRITAADDTGACATPLAWRATTPGWALDVFADCGDRTSQLVFRCGGADCLLTPETSLTVTLNYSCQSLLVTAGALDASSDVTAFAVDPKLTVAQSGSLLTSVAWELTTLLDVVNSSIASTSSARGYILLNDSSPSVVYQPLALATSVSFPGVAAVHVIPLAAAVNVTIALPLQQTAISTTLSEKQTLPQLLSSLVGLVGFFTIVGTVLYVIDYSRWAKKHLPPILVPLRIASEPPTPTADLDGGADGGARKLKSSAPLPALGSSSPAASAAASEPRVSGSSRIALDVPATPLAINDTDGVPRPPSRSPVAGRRATAASWLPERARDFLEPAVGTAGIEAAADPDCAPPPLVGHVFHEHRDADKVHAEPLPAIFPIPHR